MSLTVNEPERFDSTFSIHGIKQVLLESRWVTKINGKEPPDGAYVQQSITLKGENGTAVTYAMDVATYEANGIIIKDSEQFEVGYPCNPDNGEVTMIIKRKPYLETREGIEMTKKNAERIKEQ